MGEWDDGGGHGERGGGIQPYGGIRPGGLSHPVAPAVTPLLSNVVIASAAKQSRLLNKLENRIVLLLKTGLLRHFVPRKDTDVIVLERKGGRKPPLQDCFRHAWLAAKGFFRKNGASAVQVGSARDWFAISRHAWLAARAF